MPDDVFRTDDLLDLGAYVADRWTAGADRDWSVPAGTLDWTCTATADHAVDCVFAPATFLASRRTDRYPDMGIYTVGADATAGQFVEALGVMCRLVVDVVERRRSRCRGRAVRRPSGRDRATGATSCRGPGWS